MFEELLANFLSALEYENIPYEMITKNGKPVILVKGKDGDIGKVMFEDGVV